MSYFCDNIDADNDDDLKIYVDDVEDSVGAKGIGEKIKKKYKWISGRSSYWWLTQQYAIEQWMWNNGVRGDARFVDREDDIYVDDLPIYIEDSPVILQTSKMGGLRGGHIILCVGFCSTGIIVIDTYGNAMTNYKDRDGHNVIYPYEYLEQFTERKIRCIYWEGC